MAAVLFLFLALAASNSKNGHGAVAADDDPPAAFVVVNLKGRGVKSSLAVQTHDLSLAGFTDGSGHWHAFPGHEHLIPTSKPLPFGSSYSELIGGLANLPGVPLGREAMVEAVRVLSAYDPATTADDVEPLKRALASLTVMICEAQRLQPIYETVKSGWESGVRVAPEHLPYIDHWDTMSYEIIRANRTGEWDGPLTRCWRTGPTSAASKRRSPWSSPEGRRGLRKACPQRRRRPPQHLPSSSARSSTAAPRGRMRCEAGRRSRPRRRRHGHGSEIYRATAGGVNHDLRRWRPWPWVSSYLQVKSSNQT